MKWGNRTYLWRDEGTGEGTEEKAGADERSMSEAEVNLRTDLKGVVNKIGCKRHTVVCVVDLRKYDFILL